MSERGRWNRLWPAAPGGDYSVVFKGFSSLRCLRPYLGIVLACCCLLTATPGPATADDAPPRKLTIAVMGDSIADGIWAGLYRMLARDKRYVVLREAKNSSGFTLTDWLQPLDAVMQKQPDAVVMLIGANDRQSLVVRDKPRSLFRSKDWEEGYTARVRAFMDKLVEHNVPTVWVGLPIMRSDQANEESLYLNSIYSKQAEEAGVLYLPIWKLTADDDGKYAAYGNDLHGEKHLLRANDGVHFTDAGYEVVADAILRTLRTKVAAFALPSASEEHATASGHQEAESHK